MTATTTGGRTSASSPMRGGPIPAEAILNPSNGNHYVLTESLDFSSAEALAVSMGGHLATVRNDAENQWLVDTFSGLTEATGVLIGLVRHCQRGNVGLVQR